LPKSSINPEGCTSVEKRIEFRFAKLNKRCIDKTTTNNLSAHFASFIPLSACVLTVKEVAMSDGDAILAAVPLPTSTATTWMSTVTARRSGLPPALRLGSHQLGRGLGTSPSAGGLLGTAAAGRGAGSGGGWNVLLPLADLHRRGLSLLMIRRNGWISKCRRLSLRGRDAERCYCGGVDQPKTSKEPGNKQHLFAARTARLIFAYRRRSAKPPLLPRFQATPLARPAHLFGYLYVPCSLCLALRYIIQTMATSDKYDRQLRLWGASGQRALGETCIVLINATASGTETLKNLGKCIMCFVRTCTCSAFVVLFRRTHSLNFVLLTIFCSTLCPSSPSRCRCNPCR